MINIPCPSLQRWDDAYLEASQIYHWVNLKCMKLKSYYLMKFKKSKELIQLILFSSYLTTNEH